MYKSCEWRLGHLQIYDMYGMEGLTSGMEVGTHRAEASELKRAFDLAQMRKVRHSAVFLFCICLQTAYTTLWIKQVASGS
jgi:hypothetical protein